jgi:hypothetical protein
MSVSSENADESSGRGTSMRTLLRSRGFQGRRVTGTQGAVFTLLIAVAVPAYLISFSLLAGTLLGVVLVAVALTGRPRLTGPPVKLHIGKVELANFTPRTLVLLVGTVLVVAPVGIALFQRDAAASVSTQAPTSVDRRREAPGRRAEGHDVRQRHERRRLARRRRDPLVSPHHVLGSPTLRAGSG